MGEIYASEVYMRDENGNILVGANGLPMRSRKLSDRLANPIGNIQPKLTMSVSPSFTYKCISLSAMFDMRFGGDIYSYSEALATGSGLAKPTENRGEDNNYMMIFPGVHADGTKMEPEYDLSQEDKTVIFKLKELRKFLSKC